MPDAGPLLTIAGSDPTGGAGVARDVATFAAFGRRCRIVVTAVTAQTPERVSRVHAVAVPVVAAQLEAALADGSVQCAKTGMLVDAATVHAVADALAAAPHLPIVVDPVVRASAPGVPLLTSDGVDVLRERLLPQCHVVTPNLDELGILTGRPVATEDERITAARWLQKTGVPWVVVTGGHADGAPVDLVVGPGETLRRLSGRREPGELHGSGCAYSAALCAALASGLEVPEAASTAKGFVAELLSAR